MVILGAEEDEVVGKLPKVPTPLGACWALIPELASEMVERSDEAPLIGTCKVIEAGGAMLACPEPALTFIDKFTVPPCVGGSIAIELYLGEALS